MRTRKVLWLAVGLVMIGFLITGPKAEVAASSEGRPAGKVLVAVGALSTENLDPIYCSSSSNMYLLPLYDWIVGTDKDQKEFGDGGIAKRWKVSSDGLTWTFYLHKGIQFHEGWGEVTAKDVKFCLERAMSPESMLSRGAKLRKRVKDIEIIDPYTIAVHLKKPDAFLPLKFSPFEGGVGIVYCKDYMDKVGAKKFGLHPIGSGPYQFAKQASGAYIRYKALPKHWFIGVPKFENVTIRIVPEETTRIGMLLGGEADLIELSLDRSKEVEKAGFEVAVKEGAVIVASGGFHNLWQKCPQQDIRVRKALNLAINRQEIIDIVYRGKADMGLGWTWGSWAMGYNPELVSPYPYDPEQAKKLLKEAGYPDGFEQTIYSLVRPGAPEQPMVCQVIGGYWQKIGVKVDIRPMEMGSFRKLWGEGGLKPGGFTLIALGQRSYWGGVYAAHYQSEGKLPMFKDFDLKLNKLVDKALSASTIKQWTERAVKVEQYLHDGYYQVPIAESGNLFGCSPKIKGWRGNAIRYDLNIRGMAMLP